jgi:hypothetical protein
MVDASAAAPLAWERTDVPYCPSCIGMERRHAQVQYHALANHSDHFWHERRPQLDRVKRALIGGASPYPARNLQGDPDATCTWDCYRRATMLEPLAAAVLDPRHGCDGDFLEAGVYRGGISIFMAAMLDAAGLLGDAPSPSRRMWVADSFEGLPNSRDYTARWAARRPKVASAPGLMHNHSARVINLVERDRDGRGFHAGVFRVPLATVRANFLRHLPQLGEALPGVRFLPGFFADTLPGPVRQLALLRLDSDMYSSIHESLVALYPLLSVGGFVVFDDWKLAQARAAILDYRAEFNISSPILSSNRYDAHDDNNPFRTLDRVAFWRKSAQKG